MGELVRLDDGVWAWLADERAHGGTNAGVIEDSDGLTVVDTLLTPALARPFAAAVRRLGPPVRRVVLTSSHVEYVGGTTEFRLAAIMSTPQVSAHLDQPPNIAGYRRLFPRFADDLADDFSTRPVSHTITQPAWLTNRVLAVPLAGQIRENVVVAVPDCSIVFGGALCSFGVTPLAFEGDPAAWAAALATIVELGVLFVGGQGSIGGEEEVLELAAYLCACVEAHGDPDRLGPGPWESWIERRWDPVNVERAALLGAGHDVVPPSMLALLRGE